MTPYDLDGDPACPVCGEVGVRACVDEKGRELDHDHDRRPPFFPPGFDAIWPPARGEAP